MNIPKHIIANQQQLYNNVKQAYTHLKNILQSHDAINNNNIDKVNANTNDNENGDNYDNYSIDENHNTIINDANNNSINDNSCIITKDADDHAINNNSNKITTDINNYVINDNTNTIIKDINNNYINDNSYMITKDVNDHTINDNSNTIIKDNNVSNTNINDDNIHTINDNSNIITNDKTITVDNSSMSHTHNDITNSKKKHKIIITVPHAICIDNIQKRTCDLNSYNFAIALRDVLPKHNYDVTLIKSTQNRYTLDDNRYSSEKIKTIKKDSGLWRELRKTISKYVNDGNSHNDIIIIDSHSFPDRTEKKHLDVYFLDYVPYQNITTQINNYLLKNNISTEIKTGAIGKNSIIDTFTLHPLYIKTLLIENNESSNTDKLNIIAEHVKNFLDTFNN